MSKGDLVLVEGRLRQNNWVDEASGVKKSSTVVVAARIEKKVRTVG